MPTPVLTALIYTTFGLLCLWYLLFSLPIVVDDLLLWESAYGRVQHSRLIKSLMRPLHNTLLLTVILQLVKPLGCTYQAGAPSSLHVDASIACWDPTNTL